MIEFLYRRIVNNKWLFLCLLLGSFSTCAIISAIPMYSTAILGKVLIKDLEYSHVEFQRSPGKFSVFTPSSNTFNPNMLQYINNIETKVKTDLIAQYLIPVELEIHQILYERLSLKRTGDDFFNDLDLRINPVAINELEKHVEMTYGRMPSKTAVEGIYEAVISSETMENKQLMKDTIYTLNRRDTITNNYVEVLKFRIVGIFSVGDRNELYWSSRYDSYLQNVIFDQAAMETIFKESQMINIQELENTFYFDYHKIKAEDVLQIASTFELQQKRILQKPNILKTSKVDFPAIKIFNTYEKRAHQLKITLWVLIVPLILIMCFYSLIISTLILRNDKNEIAILKSRGAKSKQIFFLYVVECGVLCISSIIIGPYLGVAICKVLGSSNGFLEFVNRRKLPIHITAEVYPYAIFAALMFSLFVLVPAYKASNTNIVTYKRSLLSSGTNAFWKKFYLDFIVLGLSMYGYYTYTLRQNTLGKTVLEGIDVKIDPVLFFISTFFVLGVSLIFLRVYPLLVQIIFNIGIRHWKPVAYFSLVNVSKSDKNLQAIMLFLILTLSFGIVNANQARTINSNIEDRVMYKTGADIVIDPYNNLNHLPVATTPAATPVSYIEPPYNHYKDLEGIQFITKVINRSDVSLSSGNKMANNVKILGINPSEFGEVTWFRNDLLPHHINEYLNLMTLVPDAILLSSNLKEEFGLKIGDDIFVTLGKSGTVSCKVYGFIDSFPTYMPINTEGKPQYFAVLNEFYISNKLPLMPYSIWIKKQPTVLDSEINSQINYHNLFVDKVVYSDQEIIKKKNDPILLGTNGILTMCFIITMFIALVGFIIFWILAIKERTFKFGIFRAIGMPVHHITLIMIFEQVLVSGVAIGMGFLVGSGASKIFIPLLEMVYSSTQQIPKLRIVMQSSDYMKVLMITLIMIVSGLIVLYRMVKKIKVNQVIKLGEDS